METVKVDWSRLNVAEPFMENCDVMTREDVARIVERIDAGPFTLAMSIFPESLVFCKWKVPNAVEGAGHMSQGTSVEVGGYCGIPLPSTERAVLDTLSAFLKMMASHEVDEWFKVDGRCHIEPHPELVMHRSLEKMAQSLTEDPMNRFQRAVVVSDYVRPLTPHKAKAERIRKRKFDNELGALK